MRRFCSKTETNPPPPPPGVPYNKLSIGVPKETFPNERRVALTPAACKLLTKEGFSIKIESGAGALAKFSDAEYEASGATIVPKNDTFASDIVLKVRAPSSEEVELVQQGSNLISFLHPAQNKEACQQASRKEGYCICCRSDPKDQSSSGF